MPRRVHATHTVSWQVRAVYETLIEHCMGVTQEEINTPRFEATEVLQNAELHEESIPVVAFLRHV